jgi:hypothetical protein
MAPILKVLNKTLLHAMFDAKLNMVFNERMSNIERDAELIYQLGGPSKVAEALHIDKRGGAQRVQNWLKRGIPSKVKLDNPEIFMRATTIEWPLATPQTPDVRPA